MTPGAPVRRAALGRQGGALPRASGTRGILPAAPSGLRPPGARGTLPSSCLLPGRGRGWWLGVGGSRARAGWGRAVGPAGGGGLVGAPSALALGFGCACRDPPSPSLPPLSCPLCPPRPVLPHQDCLVIVFPPVFLCFFVCCLRATCLRATCLRATCLPTGHLFASGPLALVPPTPPGRLPPGHPYAATRGGSGRLSCYVAM